MWTQHVDTLHRVVKSQSSYGYIKDAMLDDKRLSFISTTHTEIRIQTISVQMGDPLRLTLVNDADRFEILPTIGDVPSVCCITS